MSKYCYLFFWFCFAVPLFAEGRTYSLSPSFYGFDQVNFASLGKGDEKYITGSLLGRGGRYELPDVCEPEGGNAELVDAYVVQGKKKYFLFICAWPVQHFGLGLNGTQYEFFVYRGGRQKEIVKDDELSRKLSAYEGSLEEGGNGYAWYVRRNATVGKLLELESGYSVDSLALVREIVMGRLSDGDVEAIKYYLNSERLEQLLRDVPVSKSTAAIYSDVGYALGQSGESFMAYKVLEEVEVILPENPVLKLNIADVLWSFDQNGSRVHYKEYVRLMKAAGAEEQIPARAVDRSVSE